MTNVFIIVNSPGEIEGWLKPVVKELKNLDFNILITVFIPPCRYSSGEECNIIKGISEVDNVVAPKDFIKYIIFSKINVEINKTDKGVIVFLGGDIIYGLLLKLKTKWPLIAYTMSFKPWPWSIFVNKYFTKKEIGNLMIDAFYKEGENTGIEEKTNKIKKIMLFSGSRKQHFKPFLPLLASSAKIIKEKHPDIEVYLRISPYINKCLRDKALAEIDTKNIIIIKEENKNSFKDIDLLVTLPGTSTIEAAVQGIPMIVVLPFNKPELIEYDGLLGALSNIPFIKRYLKMIILYLANKFTKFIALPNIEANSLIVPELRKKINEFELAKEIISLVNDDIKLLEMKKNLKKIFSRAGASKIFSKEITNLLRETK